MTSKERVLNAIEFKTPDRLPVCGSGFVGDFIKNWQSYLNSDESVHPNYFTDTCVLTADECFFPSERRLITESGDYEILNDGWGRIVRKGKKDAYFFETLETVLKEPGDIDKLVFEPADLEKRYENINYEGYEGFDLNRVKAKCADSFKVAKVGGIYIRSHFLRGEENLLIDMALDESFCNELFDRVAGHATNMALETLKRTDLWETGLWVDDDMASTFNTMFSPAMFERYFLPRYAKLIDTLRNAGCKHFFFHSDGNILPVLDMLIEAGFEGFNPLEPRSGLDLYKLREKHGNKIVFLGGVCNTQILPRGDEKEIREHVMPLIELGREGGLVIGSASFGDDISPEAYEYYMSLINNFGCYI